MSWEAQAWVWTLTDLTPLTKMVALAMANFASPAGLGIRASNATYCAFTGAAERTVQRAQDDLIESGYLIKTKQGGGRKAVNEYTMPVDMDRVAEFHKRVTIPAERQSEKATFTTNDPSERVTLDPEKGDIGEEKGCHPDVRTFSEPIPVEPISLPSVAPACADAREPAAVPRSAALSSVIVVRRETDRQFAIEFEATFWPAYPRKVAKPEAAKAFAKARRVGAALDEIMDGLRRFPFSSEVQYRPHPATWLNAGRWSDEIDTEPPTVSRNRIDDAWSGVMNLVGPQFDFEGTADDITHRS